MKPLKKTTNRFPLARKTYRLRLPMALASRLEALCEMYPYKSRSELMGDLMGLGLAQVERTWPQTAAGATEFHPDTRQPIYLLTGPFAEFRGLAHRHHHSMAHELALDEPEPLVPLDEYQLGFDE